MGPGFESLKVHHGPLVKWLSAIISKLLEAQAFDIKDGEEPSTRVGIDCSEGPPVPIPNTEVKLACADNTWRATAREDR